MWQGTRAGGHDWLARWREMYEAEKAQGDAASRLRPGRAGDPWAGRAQRFGRAASRHDQPDGFMRLLLPRLRPDDTVVDVGAGTGRYLPTLARVVARVIAVEPSAAMRAELQQLVAAEGLTNIELLAEPWPLALPIEADVVISAHVVYGVGEVGPFFLAMDRAARRECYLYLGLRHPAAALNSFWPIVYGEQRLPLPSALEALCCLHQLGIYASLELVQAAPSFRFADEEEALEEIRHRLRLPADPEADAALRAAIGQLLAPTGDGGIAPPDQPERAAVIGWAPGSKSAG